MPDNCVPYDQLMVPIAQNYFLANQPTKGEAIALRLTEYCRQELFYYSQFTGVDAAYIGSEKKQNLEMLEDLYGMALAYKLTNLEKIIMEVYRNYK